MLLWVITHILDLVPKSWNIQIKQKKSDQFENLPVLASFRKISFEEQIHKQFYALSKSCSDTNTQPKVHKYTSIEEEEFGQSAGWRWSVENL